MEPGSLSRYSDRLQDGRLRNRGYVSGRGRGFFASPQCPHRLWDPPSLLSDGTGDSSIEVKNARSHTSTFTYVVVTLLSYIGTILPLSAPNIGTVTTSWRMRWTTDARKGFVEKSQGKRPFGGRKRRWKDNSKMSLRKYIFTMALRLTSLKGALLFSDSPDLTADANVY
jgi:hypothetical protein